MTTIPALSDCNPGIHPVEFNVLVAAPPAPKGDVRSKGGIIMPTAVAEQENMAGMQGRLVAVSPLAFTYETWPEGARKPVAGDLVLFAKFAGVLVDGADGREYRVCKDRDLIAVLEEPATRELQAAA